MNHRTPLGRRWRQASMTAALAVGFSFALAGQTTLAQDEAPLEEAASQPVAPPTEQGALPEAPDAPAPTVGDPVTTQLPTTTVVGSKEAQQLLPGAGMYLDAEDIRTYSYDDINRTLRKVPGVYLREEDGYGLFPNISLRGVDTARSSKVTLMEDGILAAPAPYSAPSAYYSPTTGRMNAIEILKGSSQIQFGPHITGGVVNYVSTPIPLEQQTYIRLLYGENDELRAHAWHGDTIDLDANGRFGYLIEGYFRTTDGFKEINGFRGSDDTGFTNVEPMIKLSWEPDSERYQRWEFKYGYSDMDANVTYLGLSENDFDQDPYQRYMASRFDNIDTWANRTYLRHYIELTDNLDLSSTLYYTQFHRNWKKLNGMVVDDDGDGTPDTDLGLSAALAGGLGGDGLEALQGMRAADLEVKANNRDYYTYGLEQEATYLFDTGNIEHELAGGWRFHYDRIRRFQWQTTYTQDDTGAITNVTTSAPGSEGDRKQETHALALWVRDAMKFDKWTITPGLRYEHLWQEHNDYGAGRLDEDTQSDLIGGGVGVNYDVNDQWAAFGGAYRGYSPPGPRAAAGGIEEETSIALELGTRYQHQTRPIAFEATVFHTWFDDLIVAGNIGGAGSGATENVGEVNSTGLEFYGEYDAGIDNNWGIENPWFFSFTYTHARLDGDSNSNDPESIFAGGEDGAEVPYIPELQFAIGTGLVFDRWGVFLTGNFVDDVFTTASNTDDQQAPNGDPDARFGELDSRFIVDLSAHYYLNENTKLFGGVQNLFDEEYVASRHPHGARPGKPQFAYVGLEMNF